MAKKKYYAVKVGLTPGIYESWTECEANVKGYPKADYKGFTTLAEAEAYMGDDDLSQYVPYIGQDEVGKGEPFRIPIVAAVYLDGKHTDELEKISATRDSKNYALDTDKCIKIGRELTHFLDYSECNNGIYENEKLGITYSVYSIDNKYYNELHDNKMNANKILTIMHNRAGFNLANHLAKNGIIIKDVVIDNFLGVSHASDNYGKYVAEEKYRLDTSGVNMRYVTKAEGKYPAVAVASNIANYIEQLYVDSVRKSIKEKVNYNMNRTNPFRTTGKFIQIQPHFNIFSKRLENLREGIYDNTKKCLMHKCSLQGSENLMRERANSIVKDFVDKLYNLREMFLSSNAEASVIMSDVNKSIYNLKEIQKNNKNEIKECDYRINRCERQIGYKLLGKPTHSFMNRAYKTIQINNK